MQNSFKTEIEKRIAKLQNILLNKSLDCAIIVQKVDLFYFTGTLQQAILFVPAEGSPLLFAKKNIERCKKETTLESVFPFSSLKDLLPILSNFKYKTENIGLELDVLPFNLYKRFAEIFPKASFNDISSDIRKIRMIKSEWELEKIKKSAKLIVELFEEFRSYIKIGMRELDAAYELEYLARKKGHVGIVRMRAFNQEMVYGHLLSGKNGLLTSYVDSPTGGEGQGVYFSQGAGNKRLVLGEPFSVDFVFNYEGYLVDMTRIFFLGTPDEEYLRVYNVAKEIHERVSEACKPGTTCNDVYNLALSIAQKYDLEGIFMGPEGKTVSYIGHGIGLELDEPPVLARGVKDRLEKNVVFALEPKFFVPEKGIAGIESSYLMTDNGLLLLTNFSHDIQIIL